MRTLVVVLVALNLLLLAWNRGWLPAPLGVPDSPREPERLARQVDPDSVRVVPDPGGARGNGPAAEPAACLEAGPMAGTAADAAEQALAGLPAGAWQRVAVDGGVVLRVEAADPALEARLRALDAGFAPCRQR